MAKRKLPVASKGLGTKTSPRTNKPYSTQKGGDVTAKMMNEMSPGAKKNKMLKMMRKSKVAPF